MALVIFLIVLSVLIFVHELGHFAVAKFFGIRIDEFGLGYPPRAKSLFHWRGTEFTLNWLPFGGFVKIFGEDGQEEESELPTHGHPPIGGSGNSRSTPILPPPGGSFIHKSRAIQAAVLFAGVAMNFLFAWFLISLGFMTGMPSPATASFPVDNVRTIVTSVVSESPAELFGIKAGDVIVSVIGKDGQALEGTQAVSDFIGGSSGLLNLEIKRGEEDMQLAVIPEFDKSLGRSFIGVSMDDVGVAKLSFFNSIWQGLKTSYELTIYTIQAIWSLISQAIHGQANLSGLTGPVGLVGLVGNASMLGFSYLISLTAIISINLVIINLIPIPALDGGRLLIVLAETISRRNVPAKVAGAINTIGFLILIFLMVVVTAHDISRIF